MSRVLEAEPNGTQAAGRASEIAAAVRGTWDAPLWLANHLPGLLPSGLAGRIRPRLLRLAGMEVGAETFCRGAIRFNSVAGLKKRVRFGRRCFVNVEVFIDASAPVTLGDGVSLGHHVRIVTATHEIGPSEFRAGTLHAQSVTVGNGAWIAAGATLLPGVTVGNGAIVAAGAVVTRDVPPDTLVGGVPAKVIRKL